MELNNAFEIPLSPEQAWAVLMDIQRIAPCMPGAELIEIVDPQAYKGKVSVRLGPVALAFVGVAKFVEIDEAGKRAKIEAQGTDQKGRGGANATATFNLVPSPQGTLVTIQTQLNLSGSVAQYGRGTGMIQSVATQLIDQFAKNLRANLRAELAQSETPAVVDVPPPAGAPTEAVLNASSPSPRPAAKPISGLSLVFSALWASLRRSFGRPT